MDVGLFLKLFLVVLACALAAYAIASEVRSNDPNRDDGADLKKRSRVATFGAIGCAVLALLMVGIGSLLAPAPKQQVAQAERPADPGAASAPLAPTLPVPAGAQATTVAAASASPVVIASNSAPTDPLPTFQDGGATQRPFSAPPGDRTNYVWNSQSAPRAADRDNPREPERRPTKVAFPYTPTSFTVALRFASDDPAIRGYVDRVVRQAERESGIALTSSKDKFASLRITPAGAIVYADGKQYRSARARNYLTRADEPAARQYLFAPQVHVTLAQESGARANFSKSVVWSALRPDQGDSLDIAIFPRRKRVVLTVVAACLPAQGQFPDGAPSVYDLRGGTLAAQLVRTADIDGPKVVDLDDVDLHGAEESMRLEASLAPRVHPTVVSIVCATSPSGSIELGTDDVTIERSSLDRDTLEVCGPVMLNGFPADRPAP